MFCGSMSMPQDASIMAAVMRVVAATRAQG